MQAVAIDGTVIEVDQITHKNKGVSLEMKSQQGGSSKPRTVGFIPYDRLMYVVPDETVHKLDELDELPS